jgi:hypothetical protein
MQNETRRSWTPVLHTVTKRLSHVRTTDSSPLLVRKSTDHDANKHRSLNDMYYVANETTLASVDPILGTCTARVTTCHWTKHTHKQYLCASICNFDKTAVR